MQANDPNRPALLRTTAIRLALRYTLIYALIMGSALGVLRFTTNRYVGNLHRALEAELAALTAIYQTKRAAAVAAALTAASARSTGAFSLLIAADGHKLGGNLVRWPQESEVSLDGKVTSVWIEDNAIPLALDEDEVYWPVIATRFPGGERLLLTRRVPQAGALHDLTEYLFEVLGAAILLALLMGVTLARAILRRMDAINRTAGEIMAGDLSRRVRLSGRQDEFDALSARLNAMLDRIQQLVQGLREVTDNIAHDLRSPLTRVRNRFEVALLQSRETHEYREVLQRSVEDVEALIGTFNALLGVAQAEAGQHRGTWMTLSLDHLAGDLAQLYAPLAEEKGQHLICTAQAGSVVGSRELLAQALSNLLDNAIKFTPTAGRIRLQVLEQEGRMLVTVIDSGPGIPAAERLHVLERFVRLGSARGTDGAGLGLSLVRAVARLHHAELSLSDAGPGLRVTSSFPPAGEFTRE
ncbi:MAG: ATP-binding protein [Gammaproteobacteria bacterium]